MLMISFEQYERALERYREMLIHWKKTEEDAQGATIVREAAREALIQRFEYLTESAWKTCKRLLVETEGYDKEVGPKSLFRLAGSLGMLDAETWITFWDARLGTSHDYSEEKSAVLLSHADDLEKQANLLLDAMRLRKEASIPGSRE